MKRIGRSIVVALAIVGTLGVGLVVLLARSGDTNAPTTGLCRNPDFNPYEQGSTEFIPCDEGQTNPFDKTDDKPPS